MALTRIKTDQILDGTITGSDIASGTDITSNNLTLSGDLRGPATFTIDPAAIGDNTGTVVIAGDLQVDGATTTINSSTLTVDDKQIVIASGATDNTSADGAGILIDGADAEITYDGTNDRFEINKDVNVSGGLDVDSGTLFVDSTNNRVGVGTSSPSTKLQVDGEIAARSVKGFSARNGNTDTFVDFDAPEISNHRALARFFRNTDTTGEVTVNFYRGDNTFNEAARLHLNGGDSYFNKFGGNVGIGTSSPASKVDADGTIRAVNQINPSSGTGLEIAYNTSADIGQILSYDRTSNNWKPLELRSEDIRFQASGSEAARIDSFGNLLVGTTSFSSSTEGCKIDELGDISINRNDNGAAFLGRLGSDGEIVRFRKDGSTIGTIGVENFDLVIGKADTGVKFEKSGPDRISPFAVDTNSVRDGGISLGGAGDRFKDLYLSGDVNAGGLVRDQYRRYGLEALHDGFSSSPDDRTYELDLIINTNSGTSFYYYFDVMGYRDIGRLGSQLHYTVYIHQRGAFNVDIKIIDHLGSLISDEKFEFYTFLASTGDRRFLIFIGENFSGISVIGYDRDEARLKSTIGRWSIAASNDGGAYIANNNANQISVNQITYS